MKTTKITLIDAPSKIVFLWLEDKERLLKWVPNLIEDEPLVEKPEKLGSRFKQVFLENGRKMEMEGEITGYVENERMRVNMTSRAFDLDVDYILKSLSDNQTEVTQSSHITFKGLLNLLSPLMVLMTKLSSKDPQAEAHAKLKAMAEAEFQAS